MAHRGGMETLKVSYAGLSAVVAAQHPPMPVPRTPILKSGMAWSLASANKVPFARSSLHSPGPLSLPLTTSISVSRKGSYPGLLTDKGPGGQALAGELGN